MNQLLNILISHQCYFTNTPAVTERRNRGDDTGFSSEAGRRCVSPPGQFPPTFLQFITPRLCWYNSLLLTVIFRLFISGIQVMAQLHKQYDGTSEASQTRGSGGDVQNEQLGSSDFWGWACCWTGMQSMTQGSPHAASCHPVSCMWTSVWCAFLRSWVHNAFLRLFMAQRSLGEYLC